MAAVRFVADPHLRASFSARTGVLAAGDTSGRVHFLKMGTMPGVQA